MKIAVIIPTYQRPKLLLEAIESVWRQSLLPDEIIIGDDSYDNMTELLVEEHLISHSPVPIYYFHHIPSLKQTKNVDYLIKKVDSDYLLLLHDDDLLMPSCLEELIKPLNSFPQVVASFGNQYLIDNSGKIIPENEKQFNSIYHRVPERDGLVNGEWAASVQMFPSDAYLVRSNIAKAVGYDDNGRAGDAVDFYFGFRLGKDRQFFYVNTFTAKYRIGPESITNSGSVKFISSTVKILLEDLQPEKLQTLEVRNKLKELMNPAISEVIRAGDKKTAISWMLSSYYNLFSLKGFKRVLMLVNPF